MWALLALYQALRIAVTDAIATVPGTDPDRASYQIAVQTAQTLVTSARNILTGAADLAGDIGRAVLASLHGPRRPAFAPAGSNPRSAAGTSTRQANPAPASGSPRSPSRPTRTTSRPRHAADGP